ncbi:MAG TPA: type II toxin-antitoxin system HicB family antitoxin [Terriglobia bacterium]|nr:type II toxin-antitoxin system HicB family antitoxin [Terriglobia bacterium]
MAELTVTTYPGEDGYIVAECLEIPGCLSQGKTKEEALENFQDAIRECLSVLLEDLVRHGQRGRPLVKTKEQQTIRVQPPQVELIHT